jgi:ribosomal protein S6--L-glutamate ligase
MDIGILTTRNHHYHPNKRFIEAAHEMGHRALLIDPWKCHLSVGQGGGMMTYRGKGFPHLDVVLPRIGATIEDYEMAVVKQMELLDIPLVNGYESIAKSRDKFACLQILASRGIPVPKSVVVTDGRNLVKLVRDLNGPPVIVKLLRGRQGTGVTLAESHQAVEFVVNNLSGFGDAALLQEYVEESRGRDIRALVVGGEVKASMVRESRGGDFRSNIHLKGVGARIELSEEYREVAIKSAEALGLDVAGVDMLESSHGPMVLEVNYSPGFRELEKVARMDIAEAILNYAIRMVRGEQS